MLGLADGQDGCGRTSRADDDDVELVLGPALGVVEHRWSDACRRPPDRLRCGVAEGEGAGQVLEVGAEDVGGEAVAGVGPRLGGAAVLEAGQVGPGDDVVEAHDRVGEPVEGPAGSQDVVGSVDEPGVFEGSQRVLHGPLLPAESGSDRSL